MAVDTLSLRILFYGSLLWPPTIKGVMVYYRLSMLANSTA